MLSLVKLSFSGSQLLVKHESSNSPTEEEVLLNIQSSFFKLSRACDNTSKVYSPFLKGTIANIEKCINRHMSSDLLIVTTNDLKGGSSDKDCSKMLFFSVIANFTMFLVFKAP